MSSEQAQRTDLGAGDTNGGPAAVRDVASRRTLTERAAELVAKQERGDITAAEERELTNARKVAENVAGHLDTIDPYTGEPVAVQLSVFDPAAFDGDGRAAIVIGDLDRADHIAVKVPGFSASVSAMEPGGADRLYVEARHAANRDGGSAVTVAVIDWMGYDTPNPGLGDATHMNRDEEPAADADSQEGGRLAALMAICRQLFDGAGVLDQDMARAGARMLATDVAGIAALRGDDPPHLTVVASSYGSTTAAIAAAECGLAVDDLVLTGSPGVGSAEHVSALATGPEHTWVAAGSADAVTWAGRNDSGLVDLVVSRLGVDPADASFGATRIQAESVDRGSPLNVQAEHGRYFDHGSESLFNIAAIVAGRPDLVRPAAPRADGVDPECERKPSRVSHGPLTTTRVDAGQQPREED